MEAFEKAPAKINVCVNVLRKRSDGFHEMEMIMTPIDLSDRLSFTLQSSEITLDSNSSFMPLNEKNIVYQAAVLLKKTFKVDQGAHIFIEKNIPIAAGLGGGSSDAAAALRALNRLWELNVPIDRLAELGEQIGSDVPFCVYGQTAYVTGRGEKVDLTAPFPHAWVIVVKPPKGISSWTVFKDLTIPDLPVYNISEMKKAIEESDYDKIIFYAGNALEQKAMTQHPKISDLKEKMMEFGADAALMSGTGPTVYGLTQNYNKAKRIVNGLNGFCNEVYLVRTIN
ncbi:MAG: 4-(cytidine 5'-diphospho)-2-C-methyl-D-erythritol kinase [Alkalibacterium sp.]|nr:4-(cytidine 5'-diphospho)-2-C-methyl-D-erythritol kinase [Alkalibacterium sp.]